MIARVLEEFYNKVQVNIGEAVSVSELRTFLKEHARELSLHTRNKGRSAELFLNSAARQSKWSNKMQSYNQLWPCASGCSSHRTSLQNRKWACSWTGGRQFHPIRHPLAPGGTGVAPRQPSHAVQHLVKDPHGMVHLQSCKLYDNFRRWAGVHPMGVLTRCWTAWDGCREQPRSSGARGCRMG